MLLFNQFSLNIGLGILLILGLVFNNRNFLVVLGIIGVVPVLNSAFKSIKEKNMTPEKWKCKLLTVPDMVIFLKI